MPRLILVLASLAILARTHLAIPWHAMNGLSASARIAYQSGPAPAIIVLPGYYLPPEFLEDPARELYARGFTVAQVDINAARRPALAIQELIARLQSGPRPTSIGMFVHSGAVTPSLEAADARVRAVVALGFYPGGRKGLHPNNLLALFGTFDDYITVDEMLRGLGDTGGARPVAPGATAGSFADGSARRLEISPLSNHGGEPFDPRLQAAGVAWLGEALALTPRPTDGWSQGFRHWGWIGLGLAAGTILPWAAGIAMALVATVTGLGGLGPVAAWLALLVRRDPTGGWLVRHLVCLWTALNVAALALGIGRAGTLAQWACVVGLHQALYLPSEAAGCLAAWQAHLYLPSEAAGSLAYLGLLVGAMGLAAWLLAARGALVADWLRRWTRTVSGPYGAAAALALGLATQSQAGLGFVAYAGGVAAVRCINNPFRESSQSVNSGRDPGSEPETA